MSSEDYQNELNNDVKMQDTSVKLEDFMVPDDTNGTDFDEKINSEIPVDVDTMGVVIDKAPSLSTDDLNQEAGEISENDIHDLMADLMSSMDSDKVETNNKPLPDMVMDQETIEAGLALEKYLNSPVEELINHPEMTGSLGLEIPTLESLETMAVGGDDPMNYMDFPSMPQIPDIPEVVERDYDKAPAEDSNVNAEVDAFSGFDLDPITIDNFDEKFELGKEAIDYEANSVSSMPEDSISEQINSSDNSSDSLINLETMNLDDTNDDGPIQKLVFDDFNDETSSEGGSSLDSGLLGLENGNVATDSVPSEFAELDALLADILPEEELNSEEGASADVAVDLQVYDEQPVEGVISEHTLTLDELQTSDGTEDFNITDETPISLEEMSAIDELITAEETLGKNGEIAENIGLDVAEEIVEPEGIAKSEEVDEIEAIENSVESIEADIEEIADADFSADSEGSVGSVEVDGSEELEALMQAPSDEASSDDTSLDNVFVDDASVDITSENNISEDNASEDKASEDKASEIFSPDELEDMRKELAESVDDEDDAPGEEDIEKLLSNAQKAAENSDSENREDMSLEELLQTSNDGKAEDIGEMLDKAERNEAVDEGISALLNGEDMPPVDIDSIGSDSEGALDPKAAKKAEKLRLKEEKKEAKRKAKEAKAAEKLAKKNAKKGIEPLQKLSFEKPGAEDEENSAPEIPSADAIASSGLEHNTDMSDIEALLAGADSMSEGTSSDVSNGLENDGDIFGQTGDMFGQSSDGELANLEVESDTGESIDDIPEKDAKDGKTNPIKAFFGKIVNFLTEEDEEESEKSEIILSDENAAILDELNGEELPDKKKKKKKKDKKKAASNDENAEDLPEKKPEKKKKEKKPKKVVDEGKPEPKISTKKIAMVSLVCIMLGVVIFLITYFTADYTVKLSGRDAFLNEDYQTCYQSFYGKKLNESEQVMYNRSECILKIQIWLREYEIYTDEGSEVKALDSLVQSVNSYPSLKESSIEWGCLDKVEPIYANILDILQTKYSLTEEDALEIAGVEDDVVYTRIVNAIANGVSYEDALNYIYTDDISGNTPIEEVIIPANMDDMLPEEDGMSGESFIEP